MGIGPGSNVVPDTETVGDGHRVSAVLFETGLLLATVGAMISTATFPASVARLPQLVLTVTVGLLAWSVLLGWVSVLRRTRGRVGTEQQAAIRSRGAVTEPDALRKRVSGSSNAMDSGDAEALRRSRGLSNPRWRQVVIFSALPALVVVVYFVGIFYASALFLLTFYLLLGVGVRLLVTVVAVTMSALYLLFGYGLGLELFAGSIL